MIEAVERGSAGPRRRPARPAADLSAARPPHPRLAARSCLGLSAEETYEIDAPVDGAALMELANWPGLEHLKNADWPPQPPRDLLGADNLWDALADRDVLLFHPYESFEPVVRLVELAADDPAVLAIKQTLYRTSGDSPIVRALGRAARTARKSPCWWS